MSRFLAYVPFGALVALFPFFLDLQKWKSQGLFWSGLVGSLGFGLVVGLVVWSFFAVVFGVFTLIHIRTGTFFPLSRNANITITVVAGFLGTALGIWVALQLEDWLSGKNQAGVAFGPALILGVFISLLFFFHLVYRYAKEDALALQAKIAEARYQALESQMQPHFLFNALNSLAELIESEHEGAAEVAYTLSDLYRLILANSKQKTTSLSSEVEIAQKYLELEKVRLGKRLTFRICVPKQPDTIFLPSLMLQTLVENAIKHGVAKSVEGGHVTVDIHPIQNDGYVLSVANTGRPFSRNGSAGTGLANTQARLDLLYGNSHNFHIGTEETGQTIASFTFHGAKID